MNDAGLKKPNRSTPRRTRTFNPLIKSPIENRTDAIRSGSFDERVSGSVGERDAQLDRLEMLVEIARVIGQLPPSERHVLGSMLSLVLPDGDASR